MSEPAFFYLGSSGQSWLGREPVTHRVPVFEIKEIRIWTPTSGPRSIAAEAVQADGVVAFDEADQHLMELSFAGRGHGEVADLRPNLPLILRW